MPEMPHVRLPRGSLVPGCIAVLLLVGWTAIPARGQSSAKSSLDAAVRHLRVAHWVSQGTYGSPRATARVLEALATSPRRYRVGDGPFVRDAARSLTAMLAPAPEGAAPRLLPGERARILEALLEVGADVPNLEAHLRSLLDRQVVDPRDPLLGAFPETRDAGRAEAEDALQALAPTAATLHLLYLAGTRVDPTVLDRAAGFLARFVETPSWRARVEPEGPAGLEEVSLLLEGIAACGVPLGSPPVERLLEWTSHRSPPPGGLGTTAEQASAYASMAWALRTLGVPPQAPPRSAPPAPGSSPQPGALGPNPASSFPCRGWAQEILDAWTPRSPATQASGPSGHKDSGMPAAGSSPEDAGCLVEAARLTAASHAYAALPSTPPSSSPTAPPAAPRAAVAPGEAPATLPVPAGAGSASAAEVQRAIAGGLAYLASSREDGLWGFGGQPDAGITALALTAFLGAPRDVAAPYAEDTRKGLEWIASLARPDGSIHQGQLATYVTSVCVLALRASGEEAFAPLLKRAQRFLLILQADETEGYGPRDKFYGGIGYGGDERPDLSNLQFALDALHATGLPEGHEAYRKALVFLSRSQNRSESNPDAVSGPDGQIFVAGDDGGGIYAPGSSAAGAVRLASGKWVARSYGSMTYALLKSYLFAGLDRKDERVQAAIGWIRAHFTVAENPGFDTAADPLAGAQGLYYYYLTMARTLDLLQEDTIVDANGTPHRWRAELAAAVLRRQKPDGSWVNDVSPRWYEGMPLLVTTYAVLALERCAGNG